MKGDKRDMDNGKIVACRANRKGFFYPMECKVPSGIKMHIPALRGSQPYPGLWKEDKIKKPDRSLAIKTGHLDLLPTYHESVDQGEEQLLERGGRFICG